MSHALRVHASLLASADELVVGLLEQLEVSVELDRLSL